MKASSSGGMTLQRFVGDSVFHETTASGTPSVWQLATGRYNSSTGVISMKVNTGTDSTFASSTSSIAYFGDRAPNPTIGVQYYKTSPDLYQNYFDGCIGPIGVWNREITDEEIVELYNNGTGRLYHKLSASMKTSMLHWWQMSETSGTRFDSHGSNDGTANGTITGCAGPDQ
jgi:hypothetical protein